MHLAATRLAGPELHLNAETLQQADYRASGLGKQRVVITGYEKRSAHAATQSGDCAGFSQEIALYTA
jgi:hypothetical protein